MVCVSLQFLTRFHVNVAVATQSNVARQKLAHAYYALENLRINDLRVWREGHLYEVFLVLAKIRLI